MRLFLSRLLAAGGFVSSVLAYEAGTPQDPVQEGKIVSTAQEDVAPPPTIFNGQEVPAMTELSGTTLMTDIGKGYWFVASAKAWYGVSCVADQSIWQQVDRSILTVVRTLQVSGAKVANSL